MRARLLFVSGDHPSQALLQTVQDVLSDLALAFGHSLIIKEEKLGALSVQAYDSPMTQECIQAAQDADAVLCAAYDLEGLHSLVSGLACDVACHVFHLPASLAAHSPLKGDKLPNGMICAPLQLDEQGINQAGKLAYRLANQQKCDVMEIPPQGRLRPLWDEAAGSSRLSLPTLSWGQQALPAAVSGLAAAPDSLGLILASPLAADSLQGMLTGMSGLPSLPYSRYYAAQAPLVYAVGHISQGEDEANPFGLLLALADLLRQRFNLEQEALALDTCIHNVLNAGWRTRDIALPGEPRVSAGAICQLIREQIALMAQLLPGT